MSSSASDSLKIALRVFHTSSAPLSVPADLAMASQFLSRACSLASRA